MNHRVMTLALGGQPGLPRIPKRLGAGAAPLQWSQQRPGTNPGCRRARRQARLALPTPSAADTGPRSADFIVAIVNSEPVTNYEVRSRVARIEQQLAQQGGNAPAPHAN